MTIIQQPSGFQFAGNIKDIKVSTSVECAFKLYNGATLVVDELYRPTSGVVTVPLRELLEKTAIVASLAPGSVDIPIYTFNIGGTQGSFTCIAGGHAADTSAEIFVSTQWLTWQPQSVRTTYHTPHRLCYAALGDCSVKVKAFFADGTSQEIVLMELTSGKLYTIDTTFGTIRGNFTAQPTYFIIWIEGATVSAHQQLYQLVDYIENADTFIWNNTLGGVDTVVFDGDQKEQLEHNNQTAKIGTEEVEFALNNKKVYTKYSGYIADENYRRWVLDFFNSSRRWWNDGGVLRPILVTKPKLEHTRGKLAGYEFQFATSEQSHYLNLPRVETPELLELVSPSDELFFLAPRLNQFLAADVDVATIIIPVQYANHEGWLKYNLLDIILQARAAAVDVAEVLSAELDYIWRLIDGIQTGDGSGSFHPLKGDLNLGLVAKYLEAQSVTTDLVRAQRIEVKDLDAQNIKAKSVVSDLVQSGDFRTPNFITGLLGAGGRIDEKGNAELHSLSIRTKLTTPVLEFNKITTSNGEHWYSDSGVVSMALSNPVFSLVSGDGAQLTDEHGRALTYEPQGIYIEMTDTDRAIMPFRLDDILQGLYRKGSSAEFATVYYRVVEMLGSGYLVAMLNDTTQLPEKDMTLVRLGNFTDTSRQSSMYVGKDFGSGLWFTRVLRGMDSTTISRANVDVQIGYIGDVTDGDMESGIYAPAIMVSRSSVSGLDDELGRLDGLTEGKTIIKGGFIDTELIEAHSINAEQIKTDGLTASHIQTPDGRVVITSAEQRFGPAVINNDDLIMCDDRGDIRARITRKGISTAVNGDSGSGYFEGVTVSVEGSTLVIDGSVTARSIAHNAQTGGATVEATAWLCKGDTKLLVLGSVRAISGGVMLGDTGEGIPMTDVSKSAPLSWSGVVGSGVHRVIVESAVVHQMGTGGYDWESGVWGTMSWEFSATLMRSEMGIDGFASLWNKQQQWLCHWDDSKLNFKYKGTGWDTPGVLCKARVTGQGGISKKWGAYAITQIANSTTGGANKRVHHTFPSSDYTAIVTPVGRGVVAEVIEEYAGYVDIYSTGAFNIVLTGDN